MPKRKRGDDRDVDSFGNSVSKFGDYETFCLGGAYPFTSVEPLDQLGVQIIAKEELFQMARVLYDLPGKTRADLLGETQAFNDVADEAACLFYRALARVERNCDPSHDSSPRNEKYVDEVVRRFLMTSGFYTKAIAMEPAGFEVRVQHESFTGIADHAAFLNDRKVAAVINESKTPYHTDPTKGDHEMFGQMVGAAQFNFASDPNDQFICAIKVVGSQLTLYSARFPADYIRDLAETSAWPVENSIVVRQFPAHRQEGVPPVKVWGYKLSDPGELRQALLAVGAIRKHFVP